MHKWWWDDDDDDVDLIMNIFDCLHQIQGSMYLKYFLLFHL